MAAKRPRARTSSRTTIIDVARLAGVSPATVSRAMNTPGLLSGATLAKVRDALVRTAYIPNMLAGGLASRRSRFIAVVVPSISLGFFDGTVQELIRLMDAAGYQVLMGFGGLTAKSFNETMKQMLGRRPDAIVTLGSKIDPATRTMIMAEGVPTVQAWELPRAPIDMAVGFSHRAVGRAIAEHVIARGYRRPKMLWGGGARPTAMRSEIVAVLREAGIAEPGFERVVFPGAFAAGVKEVVRLAALPKTKRPDCLLCMSDWAAHGALVEAARLGIKVPRDLAVIGFGDLDFASGVEPPLTTVRIDGVAVARQLAALILKRLGGDSTAETRVDVGFEFIMRASG